MSCSLMSGSLTRRAGPAGATTTGSDLNSAATRGLAIVEVSMVQRNRILMPAGLFRRPAPGDPALQTDRSDHLAPAAVRLHPPTSGPAPSGQWPTSRTECIFPSFAKFVARAETNKLTTLSRGKRSPRETVVGRPNVGRPFCFDLDTVRASAGKSFAMCPDRVRPVPVLPRCLDVMNSVGVDDTGNKLNNLNRPRPRPRPRPRLRLRLRLRQRYDPMHGRVRGSLRREGRQE